MVQLNTIYNEKEGKKKDLLEAWNKMDGGVNQTDVLLSEHLLATPSGWRPTKVWPHSPSAGIATQPLPWQQNNKDGENKPRKGMTSVNQPFVKPIISQRYV